MGVGTVFDWRWALSTHRCVSKVCNQFGAICRVLEGDSKAKKLLQHFRSVEFVVWRATLRDILGEIGFTELSGQRSNSTSGDTSKVMHAVDCMARLVEIKTNCWIVLENLLPVKGIVVYDQQQLRGLANDVLGERFCMLLLYVAGGSGCRGTVCLV